MTEITRERIASLLLLNCYEALYGALPAGMFDDVCAVLSHKTWDNAEDLMTAAIAAANLWVLSHDSKLSVQSPHN